MRRILVGLLKLLAVFLLLSFAWVAAYKYLSPPITGMMFYKWWEQENYTIDYRWKDLKEINSSVPLAFISSEDQKFLDHNGFDVEAIRKAIKSNKESKKLRGASTISQQVAKNVFLLPTKSYLRKGLEVYFTFLIELVWGKERIMEVYINVVELGKGVYGVEAAAQKYFKKSTKKLSRQNAALIATALPNPLIYKLKSPSGYMHKRANWVLRQMNNLGGEGILREWCE
ncbi:monofunctional biosynthetic peptidoglycan transglycosylase [Vicingaceae bacterium]|nr:monofunctional biosynthetic peptidoglycan transglycosylase [Vicingaceae bacterium]